MLRFFPFEVLSKYPHLSEDESIIWSAFIARYPDFVDKVAYDVCVGDFRSSEEELNEATAKNREYLGRYKIDALGIKDGQYYIFEVKKSATSKALGEVWMYWHCFERDFKPAAPPLCVIVTDEERPNMREICEADGVRLMVV